MVEKARAMEVSAIDNDGTGTGTPTQGAPWL